MQGRDRGDSGSETRDKETAGCSFSTAGGTSRPSSMMDGSASRT